MKLNTHIAVISVLVDDQEEALQFYTEKLGLEKRIDMTFGPGLRLLTVASKGQHKPEIALAKPDNSALGEERVKELTEQSGQREPWVFDTNDCSKTYEALSARGVKFIRIPTKQLYGTEAIFEDPYGNLFALLETSPETRSLFEYRRVGTAA